ncbi:hypothetical protein IM25_21385 [Rhodococcus sp. p52]|uniref:hypothetical protein n=1 Tax=Rhodococcus sp. p52 TaxID=935199 RepID=UPI00051A09E3|nr:hypothetical protein [Rhodococcus sp. p52]AOD23818.1 hypothetical protein IM25_21385 [Rhodococcus sp. p52]
MERYRKKPVEIEARQWDGTAERFAELQEWGGLDTFVVECTATSTGGGDPRWLERLIVPTLEGQMRADIGDWIIRGVKGEFYPCKPDIFEATYEPVEE